MTVTVEYFDILFVVDGAHNQEEPDINVKESFDIHRICVKGSNINLYNMLTKEQFDEIEKIVLKEIHDRW